MQVSRDLEHLSAEQNPAVAVSRARRVRVSNNAIFLEVFSGCGGLSKALKGCKLESFEFEILNGNQYDVSKRDVQLLILRWVRQGKVWGLHLGTPCTIWSIARTRVGDTPKNRRKERLGRMFAHFTSELCQLASKLGIPWSIENPKTSKIWKGPLHSLHALPGVAEIFYDMCMYGSCFKKPTKLLTTFVSLARISKLCDGSHQHILAQGSSKVFRKDGTSAWVNRTTQAGAYTDLLCKAWARILQRVAPPGAGAPGSARRQEFEDALAHIQDSHSVRSRT